MINSNTKLMYACITFIYIKLIIICMHIACLNIGVGNMRSQSWLFFRLGLQEINVNFNNIPVVAFLENFLEGGWCKGSVCMALHRVTNNNS
jgi:hypothetical protein